MAKNKKQTKNQHYVPRVYLKVWRIDDHNLTESKNNKSVYVYDDYGIKVRNINSILNEKNLYTINFIQSYICGRCPSVKIDFANQILDLMKGDTNNKGFYGKYKSHVIRNRESIMKYFYDIDDWDFYYDDGNKASKKIILKRIYELKCYVLEDSFSKEFENSWEKIRDTFISKVKHGKPVGYGESERIIPGAVAEEMLKQILAMYMRNPQFYQSNIFAYLKELLCKTFVENEEKEIVSIIQSYWYVELYRMLNKKNSSIYQKVFDKFKKGKQMILFEAYDNAGTFVTSDNPVFVDHSRYFRTFDDGMYFPISPKYLIFIGNQEYEINRVDHRFADRDTVRHFNIIIQQHKNKLLISSTKDVGKYL